MILSSLLLFFSLSSNLYSSEECPIDELRLNDNINFISLFQGKKSLSLDKNGAFKDLPQLWWPLSGKHSDTNLRTSFFQKNTTNNNITQSFSYVDLKERTLSLLSLGTSNKYPLRYKNLRVTKAPAESQNCLAPYMIEWESNNPLTPQSLLLFRVFGAIKTEKVSKPIHMEIIFPDRTKMKLVPKDIHFNFGISADQDLVRSTPALREGHLAFRKLSGLMEFRVTESCPELEQPINKLKSISSCFSQNLKDNPEINSIAVVHMNEKNQRWMARFSIFPPSSSGKPNEYYSSIIDLNFTKKKFNWDAIKRNTYSIQFGAKPPVRDEMDRNRPPQGTGMSGDGKWKNRKQFMNISIDENRDVVEFEYFELTESFKEKKYKREIRPLYGKGKYISGKTSK